MLSITACIQGKSIMENLCGRKHLRVAASKAFVQSARYVLFSEKTNVKQTSNLNYRFGICILSPKADKNQNSCELKCLTKDLTGFYSLVRLSNTISST